MSLIAHGFVHSWQRLPFRLLGLAHALAEYHNAESGCYPSIQTLADRGEVDCRTVRRMLRELEAHGVISVRYLCDRSGRQISSQYDFHPNPDIAKLSGGEGAGVRGEEGTGVRPINRNKETNTILTDSCATTQASRPPPLAAEKTKRRTDDCPYNAIRTLWSEMCPDLPQPLHEKNWTDARKAQLRARWGNQLPTLDHWKTTFEIVSSSAFLTGRAHSPNRRPFRCTLWWIVKPENLSRLYEGDYDDE